MEQPVVLKVGGSVCFPSGPNVSNIRKLAQVVSRLKQKKAIVIGGGKFNAVYADALRELKMNEAFNDLIGIHFSHLNAKIIAEAVGGQFIDDLELVKQVPFPVLGGMTPGQSTDAVAATVAELLGAKLILVKDVGGVYTDNPKTNPKAKFIPKMSFDELLSFGKNEEFKARSYGVLDLQAARIIVRSKILTVVCGIENLEKGIEGKAGTLIG